MTASASTPITLFQLKTCQAPPTNRRPSQQKEPPGGGSPHPDVSGTFQKPPTNTRAYHLFPRAPPEGPHTTERYRQHDDSKHDLHSKASGQVAHFYTGTWLTFSPAFTDAAPTYF
jgi:hypothetical protein